MWSNSGPHFGVHIWTQKWGHPSENFAAARTCCASRFATLQLEHECQLIPFSLCAAQVRLLLSRSLYRSHVLTTFLGPVLGAMMKQVCWHSRRSKAYRGLPEARGQSEAHGDSNLYTWGYAHASPQNCLFWGPGFGTSFCSILRPLLATYMGEGFGGSRFRVLCGGEIYCRFWCASWTTSSSSAKRCDRHLNCVALACRCNSIRHCFLMLALLRPSRRTRQNRNRQQSAASGC